MKAIDIAKGVRKLFENERAWIQGGFAAVRELDGSIDDLLLSPVDEAPTCFCIQGGVDHVAQFEFFSNDHGDDVLEEQPEIAKVAIAMMAELEERGYAIDRADLDCEKRFMPIANWNDEPGRTIDEVRRLLDGVIERLEQEDG